MASHRANYDRKYGKKNTVKKGVFFVWLLAGLTLLGFIVLPAYFCWILRQSLPREAIWIVMTFFTAFALWICSKIWNMWVPQNSENTTTIVAHPNGEREVYAQPGPMYLSPGANFDGNSIPRNFVKVSIKFSVTNKDGLKVDIGGNVLWYTSDNISADTVEIINRLGSELNPIVSGMIQSFMEQCADTAIQGEGFSDTFALLQNRSVFLDKVMERFRYLYEPKLQESYAIEILDAAKQGISLTITVPSETEDALRKISFARQAEIRAKSIVRESGGTISFADALDRAAALLSGGTSRITTSGPGGSVLVVEQNGGGK